MKKFFLIFLLGLMLFNIVMQPVLLNADTSSSNTQKKDTVEVGKTDLILILLAVILIILIL